MNAAAEAGDVAAIKRLLKNGAKIDPEVLRKLHEKGNYDLIKWMADPKFRKFYPAHLILQWAIKSKDVVLITYMKTQGIEASSIYDDDGILQRSIDDEDFKFIDELNQIGYTMSMWTNLEKSVEYAAIKGCRGFVQRALNYRIFSQDFLNNLLRLAATNGQLNVVMFCDVRGADLFHAKCLALRQAKENNHPLVVEYLENELNKPYRIAIMQAELAQKNANALESIQHRLEELTDVISNHVESQKPIFRDPSDD